MWGNERHSLHGGRRQPRRLRGRHPLAGFPGGLPGRRLLVILLGGLLGLSLVTAPAGVIRAEGGLILATSYPGVVARPGETVTFPLQVSNQDLPDQKVTLQVTGQPRGWEILLLGGGRQVYQVYAARGKEESVDVQVKVPDEAKPGTYSFTVRGQGQAAAAAVSFSVRVSASEVSGDRLVTQYPSLSGPSDATFKFRLDLTNHGSRERSYSLGARAPEGWQVTFSPAYESKQIASVSLKAGETQGLDVEVKPPPKARAGSYNITVEALSATSRASADLQVNIMGTFQLKVSTPSGRLNAQALAGRESPVKLVVENTGSADLPGVTLSSSSPSGWAVRFDPAKIDMLAPGEKREVTAFLKPDTRAIAGDYEVSVSASAPAAWDQAELRVTVRTPTTWGLVGVIIVALVAAGVGWVFTKYGRR